MLPTDRQTDRTGYPSIDKPWLKYYPREREEFRHESMYECLINSNKDNMEAPAIMFFGKKISYSQMKEKIDAIASAFNRNGIVAGDRVVVLGLNTPEIICSVYAINKLGAIACMEYITQTESDLVKITKEYKAKYAIVIDNVYEKYGKPLIEAGIEKIFLVRSYQSMPFAMKMIAKTKMRIQQLLSKANFESDIINYVASVVTKNMGVINGKQQIYRTIISKYGQNKGLNIYNHIKKHI